MSNNPKQAMSVRVLAGCALLTALSVVLSRLMSLIPNELTRFSIEAVPLFIAGLLFGPIPGAMAGFAADFIGCLFSPYGYNPIFCVPPILYGLCAGLFRPMARPPRFDAAAHRAGVPARARLRVGALPERRARPRLRRRKQAGVLPRPARLAQRAVRRDWRGGYSDRLDARARGVFSAVRLWAAGRSDGK